MPIAILTLPALLQNDGKPGQLDHIGIGYCIRCPSLRSLTKKKLHTRAGAQMFWSLASKYHNSHHKNVHGTIETRISHLRS